MSGESNDRPAQGGKGPVFRNVVQLGQILQMLPLLGVVGLLIRLTWTAGATYEEMHAALTQEQNRAAAAELIIDQKLTAQTNLLAQKIDASAAMEDAKLGNVDTKLSSLGDKLTDLKAQVGDIVKASTPARR